MGSSGFKILKLTETWLISRVCTIRMCSGTQVLYILIWGGVEWQFHNSRCQKLFISKKIHTVAQLKIAKYEYCPSSLCENNYERHHPKYLNCGPVFHCIHCNSVAILSIFVYQISVSLNIYFSKGGLTQNDQILCPTLMCMIFVFATDCSRNWSCHQADEPHPWETTQYS